MPFSPLRFSVTPQMMEMYPALFGDRSSLHTDPDFARRSAYGGIIAWGMQPILYLSLLASGGLPDCRLSLRKLTANFHRPVLVGEPLTLTATGREQGDGAVKIEFELSRNEANSGPATSGTVVVGPEGNGEGENFEARAEPMSANSGTLVEKLVEQSFEFDEIQRGQLSWFEFQLSPEAAPRLWRMLQRGLAEKRDGSPDWPRQIEPRGWLMAPLFTTMMGMCMPGRRATCAALELEVTALPSLGGRGLASGRVEFKSASTSTILERITLSDLKGQVCFATGKVHARVHAPPRD